MMKNAFTKALENKQEAAYAFMRTISGFMFTFHGVQKIFGVLSDHPAPAFGTQMWIGGIIELVCGVLIALGAFTPYAAFLASGTMAVAYIQFHWNFQFDSNFLPGVNGGEMAALYAVVLLFMACKGSGVFSVDALLLKKK
jgi:putative oxidoreductase